MKNMKNYFRLSILLVAVLLLGSCSKDKEYTRVIPSDAPAVMSVDVASIIKKSGLIDDKELAAKNISAALKNEKLSKLVQNPSDAGLSITDKIYFFLTTDQTPILLFKVSDKDKLKEAFKLMQQESLCDEVEDASSYSQTTLHGYGICAFDNNSLIVMKTSNPHSLPVKEAVGKMMGQDFKNSINQNKGFKMMAEKKSDIGVFASCASMPQLNTNAAMLGLPQDADLRSLMVLAQVNFEDGKITADCEYYTENEDLKAQLKKQSEIGAKVKNVFLKDMPASSLAYLSTSLKGDKLYEMLLNTSEFKDMVRDSRLTPGLNFQKSISAFNGDIAVAVTNINEIGIPSVLAYAEVTDPAAVGAMYAFKKDFDEMGMNVSTVGNNEYLVRSVMLPTPIHFGVKGKTLFLTNDEACYQNVCKATTTSLESSRYQSIKESTFGYFVLDMENVVKLGVVNNSFAVLGSQGMIAKSILDKFSYVEAYHKDEQKSVVNIYLKNKNENVLKQVVAQLRLLLGAN